MVILLVFILEFLIGVAIGIFLCDKKEGLSIQEAKISSIMFCVVTLFLHSKQPSISGSFLIISLIGWLCITMGMLFGEYIRLRIMHQAMRNVHRQTIQKDIIDLISNSTSMVCSSKPKEIKHIYRLLHKIVGEIAILQQNKAIVNGDMQQQLQQIQELCHEFVDIGIDLCFQPRANNTMQQIFVEYGQELSIITSQTLANIENAAQEFAFNKYNLAAK